MTARPLRVALLLAAPLVLVALVGLALREGSEEHSGSGADPSLAGESRRASAPGLPLEAVPGLPPDRPASGRGGGDDPVDDPAMTDPLAARARDGENPWATVDLDAVRAALPDNIYWTMSSPTKDPEILRQREEERARWNVQYGKVLSSTATQEEIAAYYAHRQRLATDYIELATHLLTQYGRQLGQQDVGLLKLAVELNLARLEEIPRQIAEAAERSKAHEAARQAWLAEQAEFEGRPRAMR